jgi:AAA+ ATPase superfamily predicted ATPase
LIFFQFGSTLARFFPIWLDFFGLAWFWLGFLPVWLGFFCFSLVGFGSVAYKTETKPNWLIFLKF